MTTIRIYKKNVKKITDKLKDLGIPYQIVSPPTNLHGGCSDPGCCMQRDVSNMTGLKVPLSGKKIHKIIVSALD